MASAEKDQELEESEGGTSFSFNFLNKSKDILGPGKHGRGIYLRNRYRQRLQFSQCSEKSIHLNRLLQKAVRD
jgi:hypothetical protein